MSDVDPQPVKRQRWGSRLDIILGLFGFSLYRTFRRRRSGESKDA